MTYITTTTELIGHQERINFIKDLTQHKENKIVEIRSNAGLHKYISKGGNWQILVK